MVLFALDALVSMPMSLQPAIYMNAVNVINKHRSQLTHYSTVAVFLSLSGFGQSTF
ncbi:hypothetical protein SHLI107390_19650 [Shewanella livingstonensis]